MHLRTRRFRLADQKAFAELSGDWNPMHMDPVYARRTLAGRTVVHGVHLLLWALEAAAGDVAPTTPSQIVADFVRFVLVDEPVDLAIERPEADKIRLVLTSGGVVRADILLLFSDLTTAPEAIEPAGPTFDPGRTPMNPASDMIERLTGSLSASAEPRSFVTLFPAATAWLGAQRIAAIAAATRLVGMVCPGLHSLFTNLAVSLCAVPEGDPILQFKMAGPRHGLVTGRVVGGGIGGAIKCVVRPPPHKQSSMQELQELVDPGAFSGSGALIIGGSRGLGELTAKIIAAGGGDVTLTYATGETDAQGVAAEIHAADGRCAVMPYKVGEAADKQLEQIERLPRLVYYFATPVIARPPGSRFFDMQHFSALQRVFVDGFWELVSAVRDRGVPARFFHPSTIYIEERPAGFAEYAMAKAAAEILSAEINATMAPMQVTMSRLPRLPTDQTAGVLGMEGSAAARTLLPLISAFQRG